MRKDYETVPGQWDRTRSTSASYSRQFSQTYNAVLDYTTTFATSHNLNVMLGSEFYDQYNNGFSASGFGHSTDDFKKLGLTDAGEGKRSIDSSHSRYRILSYFGRLNYDYEGKYLFSGDSVMTVILLCWVRTGGVFFREFPVAGFSRKRIL